MASFSSFDHFVSWMNLVGRQQQQQQLKLRAAAARGFVCSAVFKYGVGGRSHGLGGPPCLSSLPPMSYAVGGGGMNVCSHQQEPCDPRQVVRTWDQRELTPTRALTQSDSGVSEGEDDYDDDYDDDEDDDDPRRGQGHEAPSSVFDRNDREEDVVKTQYPAYVRRRSDGLRYDREGYNEFGYDRIGRKRPPSPGPSGGYDRRGYDGEGYNLLGYNKHGCSRCDYAEDGFDAGGYDCEGYDRGGLNRLGLTRADYDSEGYDPYGLDCYGYDRDGRNGYGLRLQDYDEKGLDASGCNCFGFFRAGREFPAGGADGGVPPPPRNSNEALCFVSPSASATLASDRAVLAVAREMASVSIAQATAQVRRQRRKLRYKTLLMYN